jgi:hypothetical protein
LVNREPLCRIPQDINLVSSTKSVPIGSESSKVDKPSSPQAEKTTLEPSKPPSPGGTQSPADVDGALTSPTHAALSRNARNSSPMLDPTERPERSPPSPQSYELGVPGGSQQGEGSSVPRSQKQPRQYSCVAESLLDNSDFIQAEFHIGQFISAYVNTEAERENIKALYSSLETTSTQINVSA